MYKQFVDISVFEFFFQSVYKSVFTDKLLFFRKRGEIIRESCGNKEAPDTNTSPINTVGKEKTTEQDALKQEEYTTEPKNFAEVGISEYIYKDYSVVETISERSYRLWKESLQPLPDMSFDENNHLSIGSFISVESMSDAEVSIGKIPLQGLLISSRSIYKHGRHRPLLFDWLISKKIFSSETSKPNESKLCRKHPWKVLY